MATYHAACLRWPTGRITREAAEKSWRRLDGHNQLPRSSDRKLKPLPPDPFRHQNSAIARQCKLWESKNQRDYHRSKFHGRFSFIVAISNDERRDLFPGNLQFQMAQSCRLVLRSGLKKPWCLQ
jgi:hypothetical protein